MLRDIGYVNYLLFSRALALSRQKGGLLTDSLWVQAVVSIPVNKSVSFDTRNHP